MAAFAPTPAEYAERRARPRLPVSIPARLELPGGGRWAEVVDLSERGARLKLSSPPPVGASALLKWQANEVFALIVWADRDECGLRFEHELANASAASSRAKCKAEKPIATLDKMRFGAKRGNKLVVRRDGSGAEGFTWSIPLRRPPKDGLALGHHMSAAEQMFFFGAPLGHVVRFEQIREDTSRQFGSWV